MMIATGNELGKLVCERLSLDPSRVRRITINLEPDSWAEITVEFLAIDYELEGIAGEIKRYSLIEREEGSK